MIKVKDIEKLNGLYRISKDIHVNKNILFDYRLFKALTQPEERDYKYDFDVYLEDYGINLQRPYVWEHYQQEEFIKTILLEKELEPVVIVDYCPDYNNRGNRIMYVIDGKQRLMTIQKFVNNEFTVNINGQDTYFKDFEPELQHLFGSRVNYMTGTVYYSYPDTYVTDDMKIILFNFYNFAGTPQTEEHKNKLQSLINNKK
jgi:uncharacterized protein with ParB-like and HNH nuclease domain